jgi:hypothetical protein
LEDRLVQRFQHGTIASEVMVGGHRRLYTSAILELCKSFMASWTATHVGAGAGGTNEAPDRFEIKKSRVRFGGTPKSTAFRTTCVVGYPASAKVTARDQGSGLEPFE